jgi:hypothetical protein
MGNFRIEIEAFGGHGCQREVKDGGTVEACGSPFCPDCLTRNFVSGLTAQGNDVKTATFTHWPGEPGEVKDDLLTGKRTGNF